MKKQQLIEDNMNLVYALVSREYPTYLHDEDVIQCGMLGLCMAAEKWDESKSKFSTFAVICIRTQIQKEFIRRAKHQGVLSLDYELDDGEGGTCAFGEIIAGEEDVNYFDIGINLDSLSARERKVAESLMSGMNQVEIAEQLGVTKQAVWKIIRKLRTMRS